MEQAVFYNASNIKFIKHSHWRMCFGQGLQSSFERRASAKFCELNKNKQFKVIWYKSAALHTNDTIWSGSSQGLY